MDNGERRTAFEFLKLVAKLRVILDVGAQVSELRNNEFAAAWLELKPDALAAIHFDDDDKLTVLTRKGTTQPLLESSFAHRLDECVVYLDHAHTRGTDMRFSDGFRAGVTLGPKVTKDHLTQCTCIQFHMRWVLMYVTGCMWMCTPGSEHSVMFFAPLDVDKNVHTIATKSESDTIHIIDILQWAMAEMCAEIEGHASLWAQQGMDHALRYDSWTNFCELASMNSREHGANRMQRRWRSCIRQRGVAISTQSPYRPFGSDV